MWSTPGEVDHFATLDPALQARLWASVREMRSRGVRVLSPERYLRRVTVAGWARPVDMGDVPRVIRRETVGQGWTQAEHDRASRAWRDVARDAEETWNAVVTAARAEHGDHGRLISGVYYRDHFPLEVKRTLRILASLRAIAGDLSRAHWIGGSRRRVETWRRERNEGREG